MTKKKTTYGDTDKLGKQVVDAILEGFKKEHEKDRTKDDKKS